MVALIENGARIIDGKAVGVDLPEVLRPFWLGPTGTSEADKIRFI